jgi:YD repeat-containing protein
MGSGDGGVGASAGDPVNLSSGQESYQPAADLMAYNPNGLNAAWQRAFSTDQSLQGYGTPGLARGWTSNADVYVTTTPGDWGALSLHYPNGSVENLSPNLDANGQPTGYFGVTKNPPYVVTGVPGGNAGTWSYLVVTWKQGAQWNFTPLSGTNGAYVLDRIISKMGQANAFTWDASRRLQKVQDVSSGLTLLTFAYNSSGYLSSVTDAYGRQISYTFATPPSGNPSGVQLAQVSQIVAAGTSNPPMRSSYDYTGYTNLVNRSVVALLPSISVPSASGSGIATARITYDGLGRVSSNIDANGNIIAYTYSSGYTLVQTKDPQGNIVLSYTQNFDADGRDTGITDSAGKSTLIAYEDTSNPYQATSVTDEMGRTTTMTYDGFGNVVTSTSPRHITTTYTYDYSSFALGRLVQVQEGSKPPVSMSYYEPAGLPQSITAPSPTGSGTVTATYAYDSLGNVLTVTMPGITASSTRTTSFNYTQDGNYSQVAQTGQPLSVTDTLNQTTHLRYDARGNVIQNWDALGNTTDIAYNLADQPTDIWAPATGQTGSGRTHTQATYLYVGGPVTTSRLYDESGGLFRTVVSYYGPEGETLGSSGDTTASSVTYDALYRTRTLRDASNNVTSYFYDSVGNVSQIVYPGADGSGKDTVNFTAYDASGLLLQRIDGRGHITNYTYNDPEGQLTGISYPYSAGENVSYSYDAYGLPQSVGDATGTRTYTLNASDVLAQVSTVFKKLDGTLTSAKNISYTYNADGSRAGMTTPAGTFAYGYDNGGRWTGLRDHQGNATSWNYDALNRMTHQQLNSGAQTNYTYNALSQLVGLANLGSNGGLLSKFGHESDPGQMLLHDVAGNLTREVASYDPYSSSRFFIGTTNYSYDNKDQLLNETSTRYSPRNDTFGYDAMGNPTSWKGSTRSFNANNQETTGGTSQFAYDGNGNATTYKGNTLAYDEENHMTSFTTPSGATPLRAVYRSDGLRGWKQVSSGNRYFFLYDGDQIVCGFNGNGDLSRINVCLIALNFARIT